METIGDLRELRSLKPLLILMPLWKESIVSFRATTLSLFSFSSNSNILMEYFVNIAGIDAEKQ